MIKLFTANDYRNEIIRLWKNSFFDDCEYISFFLDNCPNYEIIGYFSENKLVSMLFLLNGEINGNKCKYLYAACTETDYRKKGIMSKLILFTKDYYKEKGFSGIFLVPATEKLYSYYSKFGFISSFVKYKFTIKKHNNGKSIIENSDNIEKIFQLKKMLLAKVNGFYFDDETLMYTIKEHFYNGGLVACNENSLAFYEFNNNSNIIVKEFLTDVENLSEEINKLFSNINAQNIYFLTPIVYNNKDKVGVYTKCGMCLPLNGVFSEYLINNNSLYAGMYLD